MQNERGLAGGGLDLRRLATTGVLAAMTVVATMFTRIPTPLPGGYFNLGDTVIFVAAVMLGAREGLFCGAVGSALADLFTGGVVFAPVTFVVKGAEGLLAGVLCAKGAKGARLMAALCAGAGVMVAGYFAAEATVLRLAGAEFGFWAAVGEVPVNALQGALSVVFARLLLLGLSKFRFWKG